MSIRNFLGYQGFRRYFANTSWLMGEKIFRMAVGLSVGIYVARYLGPERFGVLSYAMSFVALFSTFASLGLNGVTVRELVKSPGKTNVFLGTAFVLKLAGAGFVFIVLSIILLFADNSQSDLLIFIIATGLLFKSFNVIQFYFEAKVLSKYFVFAQIAALLTVSAARLIFIWNGLPLIYFAWAVLMESVVLSAALVIIYLKQNLNLLTWKFKFHTAIRLLKDSWPLMLSALAISIYMRIDQVMIKYMLNSEAVGQYAAAVKLSEAFYFVPIVVCGSLFPAIINSKKQSKELYYTRLQNLYELMVWIAVAIILVMTFSAGTVVELLYGTQFSEAGSVLAIHIWATLFVFLGIASGKFLIAENYTKIAFFRTFFGCGANILLNIILIQKYGIYGAAVATVISYFVATFFILFIPKTHSHAILMLKSACLYHFFTGRFKKSKDD